jgi:hypothetical protein
MGEGVAEQVGLDRAGQNGALPLEDGGDGESGGLPRLGGRNDDHRVTLLGGDQSTRDAPEHQAPSAGCANHKATHVARSGPPRGPRGRPRSGAQADTATRNDDDGDEHSGRTEHHAEQGVEGGGSRQAVASGPWPGRRRVIEVAREPGRDVCVVSEGEPVRPTIAEHRAGEPGPKPQQGETAWKCGEQEEPGRLWERRSGW